MCPALIFAANRNAKVIGRIFVLISSIITKKGFNQLGAPDGTIAAIKLYGLLLAEETINANHKGNEIVKVILKWVDVEKIYGINPQRFIKIIKKNREVIKLLLNFKFCI